MAWLAWWNISRDCVSHHPCTLILNAGDDDVECYHLAVFSPQFWGESLHTQRHQLLVSGVVSVSIIACALPQGWLLLVPVPLLFRRGERLHSHFISHVQRRHDLYENTWKMSLSINLSSIISMLVISSPPGVNKLSQTYAFECLHPPCGDIWQYWWSICWVIYLHHAFLLVVS